MAYARPSSPQSIGGVIDDGIRLFGSAFGRCWLLAILPGIVLAAYEIAFPLSLPIHDALTRPALLEALSHTPRLIGMDLLSFLLALVFQGAVMVRELAITRSDPSCTFGGALAYSLRRLPRMILAVVLIFLAMVGGALVLTLALVIVGAVVSALAHGLVHGLSVYLLGVLMVVSLLIALLLWYVRLQLWTIVLFAEDATAMDALKSSWRLTKGHWWRAGTILTVTAIMIVVLVLCFSLAGGAVAAFSHFDATSRAVLVSLFSAGANAINYPLGAAIWIAMYHDFKLRLEGGDLETRAGALSRTA